VAGGRFWGVEKVRTRRQGSKLRHICPSCPTADLRVRSIRARRHLCPRVAAPADGVHPTTYVPGINPAALAAIPDLSAAARGRFFEVHAACDFSF